VLGRRGVVPWNSSEASWEDSRASEEASSSGLRCVDDKKLRPWRCEGSCYYPAVYCNRTATELEQTRTEQKNESP
jgi:hypothetical protein